MYEPNAVSEHEAMRHYQNKCTYLQQDLTDTWEAFLEMQTKYLELLGALIRIRSILNADMADWEQRQNIFYVIKELDI